MSPEPSSPLPARPKIIFMGTPTFALPCLRVLIRERYDILGVVTQPDRPKGRGRRVTSSPVKAMSEDFGLEVLQPERVSEPEFCQRVVEKAPDILIVVAFGQILKRAFLQIPLWGALNIHASLLPKYRGPAPIPWVILNNEARTGLTAMKMDEGLDTGPILLQEEVQITTHETSGSLHDKLADRSGDFLLKTLGGLSQGWIQETSQDPHKASYAPKIERSMTKILWDRPARVVVNQIRAMDPWPGAFALAGETEIKMFSVRGVETGPVRGLPGRIMGLEQGALLVETAEGLVAIGELQVSGRKRLRVQEFLRGFSLEEGTVLR